MSDSTMIQPDNGGKPLEVAESAINEVVDAAQEAAVVTQAAVVEAVETTRKAAGKAATSTRKAADKAVADSKKAADKAVADSKKAADKAVTKTKKAISKAGTTSRKAADKVIDSVETVVEDVVADVEQAVSDSRMGMAFEEFVGHQRKAVEEAGKALESLIPEGVRTHGKSAVEEMISGYRKLFNSVVDEIENALGKVIPSGDKAEAAPVEAEPKG